MKTILRIDGVDYELKYTIDSLCYMNSFGYDPMDLSSLNMNFRTTRFLFYVGLKNFMPSLTEEDAGDLIDAFERNNNQNIANVIISTLIYDMDCNDELSEGDKTNESSNEESDTPATFNEIIDNLYMKIVGGAQMSPPFFYSLTLREAKLAIEGHKNEMRDNYTCNFYAVTNAVGSCFGGKKFNYVDPFDNNSKKTKEDIAEYKATLRANGIDPDDIDGSDFNDNWDSLTAEEKRKLLFNK